MPNKIRLTVAQNDYYVLSDQSEEYIRGLAAKLDKEIKTLMEKSATVSVTSAAVLLALNYMEESVKQTEAADNLRSQIKSYLEDSAKTRMENEKLQREMEHLREENQKLRKDL